MRGTVAVAVEPSEQTSYMPCEYEINFSPTESMVELVIGTHHMVSIEPTVIAWMREVKTTLKYAHWQSVDEVPTDADLTLAILGG